MIDALSYIPIGTHWHDIITALNSEVNIKESDWMSNFAFTYSSEIPSRVMNWLGWLPQMVVLYFWYICLACATLVPSIARVNASLPLPSELEILVRYSLVFSSMIYLLNKTNGFCLMLYLLLWIFLMAGPNKFPDTNSKLLRDVAESDK